MYPLRWSVRTTVQGYGEYSKTNRFFLFWENRKFHKSILILFVSAFIDIFVPILLKQKRSVVGLYLTEIPVHSSTLIVLLFLDPVSRKKSVTSSVVLFTDRQRQKQNLLTEVKSLRVSVVRFTNLPLPYMRRIYNNNNNNNTICMAP